MRFSFSKAKEAEIEASSAVEEAPPPAYTHAPTSSQPVTYAEPGQAPTSDQCIAHLKVLECFYRQQQQISSSDGIFGIGDHIIRDCKAIPSDIANEQLANLGQKRWVIYITRAVDRFAVWIDALVPTAQMMTCKSLEIGGSEGSLCEPSPSTPPAKIDAHHLPPLDVLMVWHALMLNPHAYLNYCLRNSKMALWHTSFPWQALVDCIDSDTYAYLPSPDVPERFIELTGLPWLNFDDSDDKNIRCPQCKETCSVPYTDPRKDVSLQSIDDPGQLPAAVDAMLAAGEGICDQQFRYPCPACDCEITHPKLQVAKFKNDLALLLEQDVPMRGSLLGVEGVPTNFRDVHCAYSSKQACTANDIFRGELGANILGSNYPGGESIESIRRLIDKSLGDARFRREVHAAQGQGDNPHFWREETLAISTMLAYYWKNSSPFPVDLVEAVVRQGIFTEKMHAIDWLHDSGLKGVMYRSVLRYERFVKIASNRMHLAVPTLDIDLVWHTHMLSPLGYMIYSTAKTGLLVDHEDKVVEMKLEQGFKWTSMTYQSEYQEPYSECICWYCEAVRESHAGQVQKPLLRRKAKVRDQLSGIQSNPHRNVHISAHNAFRPVGYDTYDSHSQMELEKLENHYEKLCQRLRRDKQAIPPRTESYRMEAWGYPTDIPSHSPYAGYCPLKSACFAVDVESISPRHAAFWAGPFAHGGFKGVGLASVVMDFVPNM